MNFLKNKAERFEKLARLAFENNDYTYAIFMLEQALQLYIKHILYKTFEDFPRTHNLVLLFESLSKVDNKAKDFLKKIE
jgi:HEPN domain-containing protein